AADLDLVEDFAQHYGLEVVERHAGRQAVILRGRVGDFSTAFNVKLRQYHHSNGGYRGRSGHVQVPSQLAGIVTGVFGLDNRPKHRGRFRAVPPALPALPMASGHDAIPAGLFSGADFAKRYQFPADANGKPLDGKGQTIAIIELGGGFRRSDLTAY